MAKSMTLRRVLQEAYSPEERRIEALIWNRDIDEAKQAMFAALQHSSITFNDFDRLIDVFRSISAHGG